MMLLSISKKRYNDFIGLCDHFFKSKGVIIIKTPNMNNLFGLSFRYQDFTHEMGFTEVTLSQIMNAAGFINIALVPEVYAKFGFKRRIANIIRSIFYKVISIAHIINIGKAPEILTPNLILVAQKEYKRNLI